MRENIFERYLDYKLNVLNKYAKKIVNILIISKAINKENKEGYLKKIDQILRIYLDNYYFSPTSLSDNLKEIIPTLEDDNIALNSVTIVHVILSIDDLSSPVEKRKISIKQLKMEVTKLTALLKIDYHTKRQKDELNELVKFIKQAFNKENKFVDELNSLEVYNVFDKNAYIKDTYVVRLSYFIDSLNKEYNEALVEDIASSNYVLKKLNIILIQLLTATLLKELLLRKRVDHFIIKITPDYFKKNNFNEIKKLINNKYLKMRIFFLVDLTIYLKNYEYFKTLKDEGFNFMADYSQDVELNLDSNEIVLYENIEPEVLSVAKTKGIIMIGKSSVGTYKEIEILNNLMEE